MRSKILKFLSMAIEYLIYGLILFIPISPAGISIFAGSAVVLFLIKQALAPDLSVVRSNKTFFIILLVFFVFMASSLWNSGSLQEKSLKALFLKWGRYPLILWMILDTFRDTRFVIKSLWVLSISAALVGLSGLSQKIFHLEFLRGHALVDSMVTGPFRGRNSFAAYLTCVIPIILSFSFWKWSQTAVRLFLLLIAATLIISSYLAQSRGGWVGLVTGLVTVGILISYRRFSRRIFWCLFSFGYFIFVPLAAVLSYYYQDRGDGARIILARGAWKMIMEHPFLGKGLGTYMDYCSAYTNNFTASYAHNCFLQIWAESGIFSLLSFTSLVIYTFYKSLNVVFTTASLVNSYILIGLNAGLLGYLIHSCFETHLYSYQIGFLFWVVLGLTVALYSALDQHQAPSLSA